MGPAAIDMRLGTKFIVFRRSHTPSFETLADVSVLDMQELIEVGWGEAFILHPNEMALGASLEYMALPPDLAAQVVTRSSYGRLGLITATAVQVHPYFHGCLTLELLNLGQVPLELTPGERVAQLVIATVVPPATPPSKETFKCSTGPEFSKGRVETEERAALRGMKRNGG
jgi:deoxycytidine triphosphate deaminase